MRTPSVQTLGVEEGRLEVCLRGDLRNAIFSRRNLSEEKTHLYLLCQQTFREVDLTFKIEFIWSTTWKRTTESKTWQPKMRRKRSRKIGCGPGQERRRDSFEHWILSWIESSQGYRKEMKQYRTMPWVRASESFRKELKYPKKLTLKTTELRASRHDAQPCKCKESRMPTREIRRVLWG